jgi:hypothetical protein
MFTTEHLALLPQKVSLTLKAQLTLAHPLKSGVAKLPV